MTTRALACILLLAATGLPLALAEDAPAYRLALHATAASGAASEVVLGTAAGATPTYDRGLDRVQAPPPFGDGWVQAHVEVDAERPELRRLQTSLEAPAPWRNATIVLQDGALDEVTLAWSPLDLAALPEDVAVELRVGTLVVDAREETSVTLDARGDAPLRVTLHVFPFHGPPPGAPRGLLATPDLLADAVRLAWDAPEREGGAPLRGYVVHRAVGDGAYAPLARAGLERAYVDDARPLGEVVRYVVTARSAVGEGEASRPAAVPGLRALPADDAPDGWEERALAGHEARVPGQHARTPALEQDHVEGAPHEDGDRYEVRVHRPDGGRTVLVLYSGGLVDARIGRTLVDARDADTPPARANATLTYRTDARCDAPPACGAGAHDLVLVVETDAARRAAAIPLP